MYIDIRIHTFIHIYTLIQSITYFNIKVEEIEGHAE